MPILLTLKLIASSTPVTDEYCFAYSSRNFGIIKTFLFYNEIWSPSIAYLPWAMAWSIPISPLVISPVLSLIGLFFIILSIYLSIKKFFSHLSNVYQIFLLFLYLSSLIITISLIQSHTLQLYWDEPSNLFKNFQIFISSLFNFSKDGQFLQWFFTISLVWEKIVFSSILSISILITARVLDKKLSPYWITPLGLTFLAYGPNSETIIFLIFLVIISFILLFSHKYRKIRFYLINTFILLFFVLLTESGGSNYRKDKFVDFNISRLVDSTLVLTFQFVSMTIIIALITFLLFSLSRKIFKPKVNKSHFITAGVMLCSQIIGHFLVGATTYISTYHWISYIITGFLSFYIFWHYLNLEFKKEILNRILKLSLITLFLTLYVISFNSILEAGYSSMKRAEEFKIRSEKFVPSSSPTQIPVLDNQGRVFVYDLDSQSYGISPNFKWRKGVYIECYNRIYPPF